MCSYKEHICLFWKWPYMLIFPYMLHHIYLCPYMRAHVLPVPGGMIDGVSRQFRDRPSRGTLSRLFARWLAGRRPCLGPSAMPRSPWCSRRRRPGRRRPSAVAITPRVGPCLHRLYGLHIVAPRWFNGLWPGTSAQGITEVFQASVRDVVKTCVCVRVSD